MRRAQRRGLAHEAADRIRESIFEGHVPPGAALREVELASSLDVSRGSVREEAWPSWNARAWSTASGTAAPG